MERRNVFELLTEDWLSFPDIPWIIIGDFNTILHPHETSGGGKEKDSDMADLKKFLDDNNLIDLDFNGGRIHMEQHEN